MSASTDALTITEVAKLENFELVIRDGLKSFVDVGRALMEIRDGRLYRETHMNFESYCQEKWGIARRTAYQYMDATAVCDNVRNCAQHEPANESQARPLARLEPEDQPAAWAEAVARSEGKPTAKIVEQVVSERIQAVEAEVDAPPAMARSSEAQESRDWFVAQLERVCDGGVYTRESLAKALSSAQTNVQWFVRMCDISPLVTVHRNHGRKGLIQFSFVRNESMEAQERIRTLAQRIVDDPHVSNKSGKAALEILSLLGG